MILNHLALEYPAARIDRQYGAVVLLREPAKQPVNQRNPPKRAKQSDADLTFLLTPPASFLISNLGRRHQAQNPHYYLRLIGERQPKPPPFNFLWMINAV